MENGNLKEVCINCKFIIPHVHEYIDNEWKYNAKCSKRSNKETGKMLTIQDRNVYTCNDFKIKTV